uniref:Reverse transcriptase domain-containing protein n=1 Tax=Trichobilharzia regenti TaxID=157069 RepID=A0AA85JU17_TRIRE|nr:unnamed protein product [Trichobilharzia regenti]
MMSLDVASLFTNIPLLETVNYICDQLIGGKIDVGIPSEKVKELLLKCTMNVQFMFNNGFYRQVDGVAMGSPLGPLLADIFLAKLENGPLKDTIKGLDYYCRYVDDTFIGCDRNLNKQELLNAVNSVYPTIQFTCEEEDNNSLPFLDVLLTMNTDGYLQRKLFRKKTWTGQYTHFHSFTWIQHKRNLVKCLSYRIKRICSEECTKEEIHKLKFTLQKMDIYRAS